MATVCDGQDSAICGRSNSAARRPEQTGLPPFDFGGGMTALVQEIMRRAL